MVQKWVCTKKNGVIAFTNPREGPEFKNWDAGLVCWNEDQPQFNAAEFNPMEPICYDYEVRFCCKDEPVAETILSSGTCPENGQWSDWLNADSSGGYADFEALSWHENTDTRGYGDGKFGESESGRSKGKSDATRSTRIECGTDAVF